MARRTSRSSPRPPAPRPVASPRPWRPIAIVLAGLLAYANTRSLPLVFDDLVTVLQNPQLREWWNPAVVLFPARELPVAGRPIVNVSFALNYAAGALDLHGYHDVNIALHLACALMLFVLVRRTLRLPSMQARWSGWADDAAFAAALLWVLHPINSEVVNYLTQRTESMMALAFLSTMYASLLCHASPWPRRWQLGAVVACLIGMACKESMVTAPVVVVAYDAIFVFGSLTVALKSRWRFYLGLAASWLLLAALLASGPRSGSAGFSTGISPWTYLLNQAGMIVRYLRLMLWPTSLVLNYGAPTALALPDVLPQVGAIFVLLALTAIALVRRPTLGFLGVWFFVTLAPTSTLVPIATEVGAERRMYLPSMAMMVALVVFAIMALDRPAPGSPAAAPRRSSPLLLVTTVVALLLMVATLARNREYGSALSLAQTSAARWPSPMATLMLGTELAAAGQPDAALPHLRAAAQLMPRAHYYLGVELFNRGDFDGALTELQQFVAAEPSLLEVIPARALMGRVLMARERWAEAIEQFDAARRMAPANAEAQGLLAEAYFGQGSYERAIETYRGYLTIRPNDLLAMRNLGTAFAATGQVVEAIDVFSSAVALDPTDAAARRNLATALFDHHDLDEALIEAHRAIERAPRDPALYDLIGRIHAIQGRVNEAEQALLRALELAPGDPQVRDDLSRVRALSRTSPR